VRALLVINSTSDDELLNSIAAGRSPRKDFIELQHALNADMVDLSVLDDRWWTRLLRIAVGTSIAQALAAWRQSSKYNVVFADRESTGFALGALFRIRARRPKLVVLTHLLTPAKKQQLFRSLRLRSTVDCLIVHSSPQRGIAVHGLGLPMEQVAMIPYHSDDRFWTPLSVPIKNQICSAGLEYRDHRTLIEAVGDLDVDLVIAAASHWSKHQLVDSAMVPPRVHVASLDYHALRQLYAESLFVVVPLMDVDNQAGITTILEAMAVGKAIIVSCSRGQLDVIRDRRRENRVDPTRATQSDWVQRLGAETSVAEGQTGIYVMPGDIAELRRAILFLLEHPEQAHTMGTNGRAVIQSTMSLDHYVARLAAIVSGRYHANGTGSDPGCHL
jgi:glycosyltransferase involved in cell wall biosynthesis